MSTAYGVLCRLLWYTSLASNTSNLVTVEFTTPRTTAPDGILLCFTDTSFIQTQRLVRVQSLQQGGTISVPADERQLVGADWKASAFFQSDAAKYMGPLKVTDVITSLDSDPHYSTSRAYAQSRYDDLAEDQQGNPLPSDLLQQTASNAGADAQGHCLLVSGQWQAATRYQMTLAVQNPPAAVPATTAVTPPSMWLAPLSYQLERNSGGDVTDVKMFVRGSKQGQLCKLRPKSAALLPKMFDACDQALARGLVQATESNATVCVSALQSALAGNSGLSSTFPFNLPPVAQLSLNSSADVSCPAGQVLSSNLGGECIDCTNAAVTANTCTCLPGFITNLMGPAACGPPINPNGYATGAAQLAQQLCVQYTDAFDKMMKGQLSDRLVHTMHLDAFSRQAEYLLDWTSIYLANQTFWRDYMVDNRMPSSPSRRTGIGPNCTACYNGQFTDIYTKKQAPVRDDRFKAVNTFRLIGYLLRAIGYPCPSLWDPRDPLKWMYGRYDKTMCSS